MSGHMADAGGEVVAANGFGTRIMMIDKDARRMDVVSACPVLWRPAHDTLSSELSCGASSHLRPARSVAFILT